MKKLYIFALVATMFAACATDAIDEQSVKVEEQTPDTLVGTFEGDDSRIQLNEAQKTVWTKDDLVSVFYRSNANQQWQYQGETGERTGNLKRVANAEGTQELSNIVVVYPYNENYYINPKTSNVQASLPAVQTYLKDSYGLDGNIMVSQSEYNQFSLKNVCGWLKIQLTGNGEKVQSIKLKGNNGEQVAGDIYINSADATSTLASEMGSADDGENSAGGNLIFDDTILTEVVLNCGEGVTLSSEATAFYIALPPQTFERGLTIEILATDGSAMTKSTDKEIIINRNAIQSMAAFGFEGVQPNNVILYMATAKVEPNSESQFGANIVSNIYENGKGVITFDRDVTSIGEYAFYDCTSLTSITIPDSVTKIGEGAFSDCTSLSSITIPDSVTEVGVGAFHSCTSLTGITIPDSVNKIGFEAFSCCSSLTSIIIPDSVTEVGFGTFLACTSLTSVTIPDSVTKIGEGAFSDCTSLTSIIIPDSVTEIGDNPFSGCTSLTAFYGKFAFTDNRCLIVDGVLKSFAPAGLTKYTIPDSITSIGGWAFSYCSSLTGVTIPNSVTSIGMGAFSDCALLTSVAIPDSVTSIGGDAYFNCTSLTSITIPDSITSIGDSAFCDCTSLKDVYCKPTTPPTGGYGMFLYRSGEFIGCKIYVPISAVDDYKAAEYWSDYAGSICGMLDVDLGN